MARGGEIKGREGKGREEKEREGEGKGGSQNGLGSSRVESTEEYFVGFEDNIYVQHIKKYRIISP